MVFGEFFQKVTSALIFEPSRAITNRRQKLGKKHPLVIGLPMRYFIDKKDRGANCFEAKKIEFNPETNTVDVMLKPVFFPAKRPLIGWRRSK